MNILLVGYYGHGNFGDDVLFLVVHRLARSRFPDARIAVQTEAPDPGYLAALAGEPLQIVRLGERCRVELALHGGGGNFVDLIPGTPHHAAINAVARTLGPRPFAALYHFLRTITRKSGIVAERRVALGLGVGTYTPSADRLLHELPVLVDMDYLGVRDALSVANLKTLGLTRHVHRTGDLAFAGGWGERDTPVTPSDAVIVILRDWHDEAVNRAQLDALAAIAAGRRASVLLLDRDADCALLPSLADFDVLTYRPGDLGPVIDALAGAPAIVTSRAHGAICGAVLGTPSLLLPIEPKLHAVHSMLPASTVVSDPAEPLGEALDRVLAIAKPAIAADVAANHRLLRAAIADCLQRFPHSHPFA